MKNDPLLLEIQEEISRENMVRFVNKYGKLLVAAGVLVFIGIAAFQFWQQYAAEEASKAGSKVYTVMKDMDKPQDDFALKTLDETAKSPGYHEISLLNKAQLQTKNGKFTDALASYDAVAKSNGDKPLKDLAALNAANLLLNTTPKAEGLEKRLTDMIADNNSYKYNAMELLAAFYIQNGNQAKGEEIIQKLAKDAATPVSIAKRARELSSELLAESGANQAQQTDEEE